MSAQFVSFMSFVQDQQKESDNSRDALKTAQEAHRLQIQKLNKANEKLEAEVQRLTSQKEAAEAQVNQHCESNAQQLLDSSQALMNAAELESQLEECQRE